MRCPRCGFEQPEDLYCANCGVEISSYLQRKVKKRRVLVWCGVAIGVAAILLGGIALFSGEEKHGDRQAISPSEEEGRGATAEEMSVEKESIRKPSLPEAEPEPEPQPEEREVTYEVEEETPPEAEKPTPPEVVSASLETESMLVKIPIGGLSGYKEDIRVTAVRNGVLEEAPFQLDSGWSFSSGDEIQEEDSVYVPASEGGDLDNQIALATNAPRTYIVRVDDEKGGSAWFYLSKDRPLETPYEPMVTADSSSESIFTDYYGVSYSTSSPGAMVDLELGTGDVLDRLKIRYAAEDYVADENSVYFEDTQKTQGPILARFKREGGMQSERFKFPFSRRAVYYPDHFVLRNELKLPDDAEEPGRLRVYLDFSEKVTGLKIFTSGDGEGEVIDGERADTEVSGNWFIIAGADRALRVTMLDGGGKLFLMDDIRVEDPPESEDGCLGCAGFEFSEVEGSIRFELMFESLDWQPGDKIPPRPDFLTAIPELLE